MDKIKKNISFLIAFLGMTAFRLFLGMNTLLTVRADWIHDDGLMMEQTLSILAGNWLGAWDRLTLIKGCVYPLFLAFCYRAHIPYLAALYALYLFAIVLLAAAVRPIIKNRWMLLGMYAYLAFSPCMFNYNTVQYIYRNALIPAASILVAASFTGMFLRRAHPQKMLLWLILSGMSISFFYPICENSIWLGIFALGASAITGVYIWKETEEKTKRWRIVLLAIPFLIMFLVRSELSYVNYRYYGAAILNSRTDTYFKDMMADMISVARDDADTDDSIWITESMMADMMSASATLGSIEPYIEASYRSWNQQKNEIGGDFTQWVLLDAMQDAGVYDSFAEGDAFCRQVHEELIAAFSDGSLAKTDAKKLYLSSNVRGIGLHDIPELLERTIISMTSAITLEEAQAGNACSSGDFRRLIQMSEVLRTTNIEIPRNIAGWAFARDDAASLALKLLDSDKKELADIRFQDSEDVYESFGREFENAAHARFEIDISGYDGDTFYLAVCLDGEQTRTIELDDQENADVIVHFDGSPYLVRRAGLGSSPVCRAVQEISGAFIKIYQILFKWIALLGAAGYALICKRTFFNKDRDEKKALLPIWYIVTGLLISFVALQVGNCWYMSFLPDDVYRWWVFNYASGSIVVLQIFESICIIRSIALIKPKNAVR